MRLVVVQKEGIFEWLRKANKRASEMLMIVFKKVAISIKLKMKLKTVKLLTLKQKTPKKWLI